MVKKSIGVVLLIISISLVYYQTAAGVNCGPDEVWVPGYKTARGVWVDGWCRPTAKTGHDWVPGRWEHGDWVPGHWKPVDTYKDGCGPGRVWVPGHRNARGRWISGHCK